MGEPGESLERLSEVLRDCAQVAVAVSGGVDSITLGVVAHRFADVDAEMFHAVSPAVPEAATARVRKLADTEAWQLRVIDADEFNDADYMANPVDRCFYCKRDLYGAIAEHASGVIVSGTNLDDLSDYRPGLDAAKAVNVRHPFVEADIDKNAVRALATHLGLGDLAELPAAPCLSSRVETGLRIRPEWLAVIDAIETEIRAEFNVATVRCRIRAARVAIELDPASIRRLPLNTRDRICADVGASMARIGVNLPVTIDPYHMGSAFLRVRS